MPWSISTNRCSDSAAPAPPERDEGDRRVWAVHWLGSVDYERAQEEQERFVAERREGTVPDTLLLLEHPPVITLGRGSDPQNVLVDRRELARRGVQVRSCGRGGDVTYHGPGQLVGYPILRLRGAARDVHRYLRQLEQGLIRTALDFGVSAHRRPGLTGVWVGRRKLAAIGVRLSTGWITSHGFALNVSTDLRAFSAIVPCGIRDGGVTSLADLLDEPPALPTVALRAADRLGEVLGFTVEPGASELAAPPSRQEVQKPW
jgi:lipoyl(octanoyl) transferase